MTTLRGRLLALTLLLLAVTVAADSLLSCMPDCRTANLVNMDLSGGDLSGVSFAGANLNHADLTDANLAFANLNQASLFRTDFASANLAFSTLVLADMNNANLAGASLNDANLVGALARPLAAGAGAVPGAAELVGHLRP